MNNRKIALIDHKCANLHSVIKVLELLRVEVQICTSIKDLEDVKGIILPGVGSFDTAMKNLKKQNLIEPLGNMVLSGTPILGICLGMQLLMETSEEGSLKGLGLIKGTNKILASPNKQIKIPHMGWNNIEIKPGKNSRILFGIKNREYFYFVHSYKCVLVNNSDMVASTSYGQEICAVIETGNIFATQFHPEKSGEIGIEIYKNFISLIENKT